MRAFLSARQSRRTLISSTPAAWRTAPFIRSLGPLPARRHLSLASDCRLREARLCARRRPVVRRPCLRRHASGVGFTRAGRAGGRVLAGVGDVRRRDVSGGARPGARADQSCAARRGRGAGRFARCRKSRPDRQTGFFQGCFLDRGGRSQNIQIGHLACASPGEVTAGIPRAVSSTFGRPVPANGIRMTKCGCGLSCKPPNKTVTADLGPAGVRQSLSKAGAEAAEARPDGLRQVERNTLTPCSGKSSFDRRRMSMRDEESRSPMLQESAELSSRFDPRLSVRPARS